MTNLGGFREVSAAGGHGGSLQVFTVHGRSQWVMASLSRLRRVLAGCSGSWGVPIDFFRSWTVSAGIGIAHLSGSSVGLGRS